MHKSGTCLGKLCKHGHEYENTGQSLRYVNSKRCVECEKQLYGK